ncbi:MAG: alpha/beta hydrolase [Flavobacteriales bacterium]|nr:alpha/beta hydrolase [Flavobacteriales bacterium]
MRTLLLIYLGSALFFSCKKDQDLSSISETIYVRNKSADMPVYMRGNMSSKVIILIVHGGPGGNGLEYRTGRFSEELEAHYAVAYWDQRGNGMSHGKFKKSEMTIDNMVHDMYAVIKVLKAKYGNDVRVFALGHSWGGTLTAKFMISSGYQYLLTGWIEADGAHDIPKLNVDAIKMFRAVAQEQIALGNNVDNWNGILSWANEVDTNNISVEDGGEINQKAHEVEEWLRSDGVITTEESGGHKNSIFFGPTNPFTSWMIGNQTNSALQVTETLAMTNELHLVSIPCLFLWGKYDFVVPPSLGVDAFNEVNSTNKKLVIFDHSGHSPMADEWEKFAYEVVQFVDAVK